MKFEFFYQEEYNAMDKLFDKLLAVLRKQVNQNNDEIRYNQDEIYRILSESRDPEKQSILDGKYSLNRELLDENSDLINFQLAISDFMDKYGYLFEDMDNIEEESDDDLNNETDEELKYFSQTIHGKIKFDQNHPQFNNHSFFNQLLKFYEEKEDYEMCEKLLKMKNSI